jgi:hypothetical protein
MPTTYKILGQQAPAATTPADLYTVPAATSTVVSSIIVANRGASPASFRVSFSIAGAGTANKDYIYYDVPIDGNDTFIATIGVTLAATDKIRVYASTANVTFQAFGSELT